jgi:hypothetical protein
MVAAEADRNFLFGLVALQVGLIDQSQLFAALQAWTHDQTRPLAEHLVARGDLDGEQCSLLDKLVERTLADVPTDGSKREGLTTLADPLVKVTRARDDSGLVASSDTDLTAILAAGIAPRAGRRFCLLRPLAKGGLGNVHVALDTELGREVALKEIQRRFASDPVNRSRFEREAEVTGRLEHPGVVPVHSFGHDDEGRPYYVMRLIRGETLGDAIARYHKKPPPRGKHRASGRCLSGNYFGVSSMYVTSSSMHIRINSFTVTSSPPTSCLAPTARPS